MSKLIRKEQRAMHKHPVFWPAIIVVGGAILLVFALIYLLYRSYFPQRDPQDMNHPVQQFENNQQQKYLNTY